MAIVSLEMLKRQVRADDFADDDCILQQCLDAAEDYVVRATNRTLEDLYDMGGGQFPPALAGAVLMLAASRYATPENDSAAGFREVPYGVTAIIKQFRKLAD